MKLVKVGGYQITVRCCQCKEPTVGGENLPPYRNSPAWADLDGEPFKAYYCDPCRKALDNWVPACGGTEEPFITRTGRKLLYCWQPSTGDHAYIDCGTDLRLSEEEARLALATY